MRSYNLYKDRDLV